MLRAVTGDSVRPRGVVLGGLLALARSAWAEPSGEDGERSAQRAQIAVHELVGPGLATGAEIPLVLGVVGDISLPETRAGLRLGAAVALLGARALPDGLNLVGVSGDLVLYVPLEASAQLRLAAGAGRFKRWDDEGCFGFDLSAPERCRTDASDVEAVPALHLAGGAPIGLTQAGSLRASLLPQVTLVRTFEGEPLTLGALTMGVHFGLVP